MANYRAVASGNWSAGATWGGGAVPPNGEGHNIYSNNFTVTIDQDVNVALITNASITAAFVGGGTSAAAGGGFTVSASGFTINANLTTYGNHTSSALTFAGGTGTSLIFNGNVTGGIANGNILRGGINLTGAGTLTINGNVTNSSPNSYHSVGVTAGTGFLIINGNLSTVVGNAAASVANGNLNCAVYCFGTNNLTVNSATITGGAAGSGSTSQTAIWQTGSSTVVTLNNCIIDAGVSSPAVIVSSGAIYSNNGIITATNGVTGISSSILNAYGTFVYSPNGTNPIGGARLILGTTPTNAYTQFALNGINSNSFVRYYTADNNLGQANPTDVRSGVSYASGNLTGRLTVPARGSVALSVNYGPSMPFTATRSDTTATATLAYSYPLVAGDQITVTGASNTEWNSTYTIASVVSGTSVTFTVPNTHSASAGTGANMQTTGTAVLDPTAVASAVWGAASRTITGGVVDTLTNAPTVPSASAIASQVRTELTTELNRIDAAISSRLAPSGTLATVTNLTNAPASVTPADIWSHATRTITGGTVDTLTNAPSVPSATTIASQVRTELSTELGRLDATVSSRLASASYTAPANSDITAIKAKTDALPSDPADQSLLEAAIAGVTAPSASTVASAVRSELSSELAKVSALNTDRLAQCSTVATTGSQLAAALS
jgi:hypothetical protein